MPVRAERHGGAVKELTKQLEGPDGLIQGYNNVTKIKGADSAESLSEVFLCGAGGCLGEQTFINS